MTSSGAYELALNQAIQRRVEFFMFKAAIAILNGTPDSADLLLGQRVLDRLESVPAWSIAVMNNAAIFAGNHTGAGDTITDPQIETAVNSLWSAFKK